MTSKGAYGSGPPYGIEPPPPAFSGLPTELAKRFQVLQDWKLAEREQQDMVDWSKLVFVRP